jgi:hypothetical protein
MREKLKRRNIMLPDRYSALAASLRDKTDAVSESEVVRRAIPIYEALVNGQMVAYDKKRGVELVFLEIKLPQESSSSARDEMKARHARRAASPVVAPTRPAITNG